MYQAGESQLIALMREVGARFPGVKVFSLPSMGDDGTRRHVELGVRGEGAQVGPALQAIRDGVSEAGFAFAETQK